jgi:3-phenylpropionate/trans-cinnamate dioxygenase ferredoxin reductase subunit
VNEHVELLVIGGGPAGLAAAQSYREHGGDGPVLIVSADPALPYARPPLSKTFLRGDSSEDELPLQSSGFYRDLRIDTRLACEVTTLRPSDGVAGLGDGRLVYYRACVLATGATPAALPVPGADDPRVHRLRSLASARALIEQADPDSTARTRSPSGTAATASSSACSPITPTRTTNAVAAWSNSARPSGNVRSPSHSPTTGRTWRP